ncbi:uncharacterized protein LOC121366761 isoform X2 [Gigantopelta aegis]|uniref:uncharacterized protein LOC121366761 isoform X2 n=1 Tax=Gigantopelta aegis TaxID=1735272 RepID=UPI001B88B124|nr:uncharacterized protein LOC121366761 isoform X2 [Gigantopelta aegis]
MNESLVQYRHFRHQLKYPTPVDNLDTGTECPACFQNPTKIISMDADFQLVRKFSSGKLSSEPKHLGKFFVCQADVDAHIAIYLTVPSQDKSCSEFQAGSALRSKIKNKKLDETAVFGSACRHSFPKLFFNLKHGERIGYSVFLVEKLLAETHNQQLHVFYDIACLLKSHLKKNKKYDILEKVNLVLPIFHCYGHKMNCQILYSPRRTSGVGLTDGECLERLWSYLGKFSNITKEMTPENRTDLLVDALIYYGHKIRNKLGYSLVLKYQKAQALKETSTKLFEESLQPFSAQCVTPSEVQKWSDDERLQTQTQIRKNQNENYTPEEAYAVNLRQYQHFQIIKDLSRFERNTNCTRWDMESNRFQLAAELAKSKEILCSLSDLHQSVSERRFLLQLLKKYASKY